MLYLSKKIKKIIKCNNKKYRIRNNTNAIYKSLTLFYSLYLKYYTFSLRDSKTFFPQITLTIAGGYIRPTKCKLSLNFKNKIKAKNCKCTLQCSRLRYIIYIKMIYFIMLLYEFINKFHTQNYLLIDKGFAIYIGRIILFSPNLKYLNRISFLMI